MAVALVGGAALGAAFQELLKVVLQVGGKVVRFQSSLSYLTNTLKVIAPTIEEIEQHNNVLGRSKEELESVIRLMEKGTKLVRKCSKVSKINFPAMALYEGKIEKLVNSLVRFFIIDMQAQSARDQKETLLKVNRILSAVKKLPQINKEDIAVAGTSSGPVIPVIESEICYSTTSQLDGETNTAEQATERICEAIKAFSPRSEHRVGKGKAIVGNNSGRQVRTLDMPQPKIEKFNHEVKKKTPKPSPLKATPEPPPVCNTCGTLIEQNDAIFYNEGYSYCNLCHNKQLHHPKGLVSYSFDIEDLLRAKAEKLGRGSYGTTYKVIFKDGIAVAMKRLKEAKLGKSEFEKLVKIVQTVLFEHPNVISLRTCFYGKGEMLLIYDYMDSHSLSELLHGTQETEQTPLDWDSRMKILLGAAKGIAHIHLAGGVNSVHGNIKSSNILVTSDFQSCISDYCLSSLAYCVNSSGNNGYQAPEVVETGKPTQKSDLYSYGVVLGEMLTGKPPTEIPWEALKRVYRFGKWIDIFDIDTKDSIKQGYIMLMLQLTMQCVAMKPQLRPSMADVVKEMERIREIAFEWYRR